MLSDDIRAHLIDHLPDGLVLVRGGLVVYLSDRACEIMGVSARRIHNSSPGALGAEAASVVQRVLEGSAVCTARDLPWSRPGGARRLTFVGSPGAAPDEVLLVVREAVSTTDPIARESFRRRLEWLDGMAAGMAHEIRNPLGGIRGAAQLLRRAPGAEEMDELTSMIIRETDRIDSIVEQLMQFARPRLLQRTAVQLNRLVHDEVAVQQAHIRAREGVGIELVLDLDPSLPTVEGDPDRLREAVANLLRNAVDAARARVHVSSRVEPDGRLREAGRDRGTAVRLTVTDDGLGIDPDKLNGLFAPFVTTKTEGSGLGLFVTRLATDAHAGMLDVEPGPGTGARFALTLWERLPQADPSPATPSSTPEAKP
jgi:two-component system nitrogen regulation sensor histidine kinase GlnL